MNKALLMAAVAAVVVVAGLAGPTLADDGNLSQGMLADMGLSGIQIMSDRQGQEIRGKGYAAVYGYGVAVAGGKFKSDSYYKTGSNMVDDRGRVQIRLGRNCKVGAWSSSWAFAH